MTDAQARAPLLQIGATVRKPAVDRGRRQPRGQRRHLGPAREQRVLHGAVIGPERPIRATLHDAIAEGGDAQATTLEQIAAYEAA